jgi:L-2-hydroxyglutarate oxidase
MAGSRSPDFDVLVIGAGVLGVTIAYWLSAYYDCSLAIADLEAEAGMHTSSRNTGVIHRPFYLDPIRKRTFARACNASLPMWRRLAENAKLPWKPVGTFNVAVEESEVATLKKYHRWGLENGMEDGELELLDGSGVSSLEPEVKCKAGLLSKTDVSVDFGAFTRHLWRILLSRGVRFLSRHRAVSVQTRDSNSQVRFLAPGGSVALSSSYLVNASGGGAVEIAHSCGDALEYATLNFRGEYWVVDEPFASRVTSNIYRPPRFPQFPFLDPHFVVRASGERQIGPNAVLVPGPFVYSGLGVSKLASYLGRPVEPKLKLMMNGEFLSLLAGEWRSSLSKRAMCDRVRNFVPELRQVMLNRRAVFGVRSSVISNAGFVPEAVLLTQEGRAHVVNFNSPGATGAPAYSAAVVAGLGREGHLDGFKRRDTPLRIPGWDLELAAA